MVLIYCASLFLINTSQYYNKHLFCFVRHFVVIVMHCGIAFSITAVNKLHDAFKRFWNRFHVFESKLVLSHS